MRVLFAGRKRAGCDVLRWTHHQGMDVAGVLTDDFLPGSPCAEWARENRLPMFSLEEAEQAVRDGTLSYDLGVSFVYWRVLHAPLLDHPSRGFINFHPAPLPALKGVGGYNIAILDDLPEYGVTAHYVDAGIDTGPIIELASVAMDREGDTARSLEARSMKTLSALYRRVVARAAAFTGTLPTIPNEGGRHVSRREMDSLKRIGPHDDADRKARAFWFPPYDGAYFDHHGERHTVVPELVLESLGGADTHLKMRCVV